MAAGAERVRFSVEAMVRGYHAYKDVWDATIGEQLPCQSEHGNAQDAFAVASGVERRSYRWSARLQP